MRLYKTNVVVLFFCLFFINGYAQKDYPQNYFRNPLSIPIQLASNFGELRPDHFHMGLDIRTQSRENLPVHAAAAGYVSRIKIEKYGYGKAIYIKHPNGYTTLYAHLNSFFDGLEQYVKTKQYKDEQWEQDFNLPENLFPVTKGQFIANSGNTGGSQGPHLHFEIRDSETGNNLNPLLFGLNIPDNIQPIIYGLYWYDRRYSVYTATPQQIPVIKKGNGYAASKSIVQVTSPIIMLGVRAEDKNNGSPFKFGVYSTALYMDDSLLLEFKANDFSYNDTRYVNACMDYTKWMKSKQGIQYLSVLPGNKLNVFTPLESDGRIELNDTKVHTIKIEVSDANKNKSTINFSLQYNGALKNDYEIPANAFVCDVNEKNNIQTTNARINFSKNAFYDALPLTVFETPAKFLKQVSTTIHVGDYTIPVHDDYNITIKKAASISNALKDKIVMQLKSGHSTTIKKGIWQNDWMLSSFNELGEAALFIDTIAPVIIPVSWKNGSTFISQKTLIIKCTDDVSRIESFRATLDGNWLMFRKKNDLFMYDFDEHCGSGRHTLNIVAIDVAGNRTTETFYFTKQ